jgi:hypothetical protein
VDCSYWLFISHQLSAKTKIIFLFPFLFQFMRGGHAMPWCPKCHTEYIEGSDTCADCHIPLVDENPVPLKKPEQKLPPRDLGEPVLLTTVYNTTQVNMLMALLKEEQIPAYQINRGLGGYWRVVAGGGSFSGVEIYVPEQLLEHAWEIARICGLAGY